MVDTQRNKTWQKEQKQQFGRRLRHARKRAGFRKASDAIFKMGDSVIPRTYYAHEQGTRVPDDDATIELYANTFGVTREFLLDGVTLEQDEAAEAYTKNEQSPINQRNENEKITSSQFGPVRYIPILTATDIKKLTSGKGNLADMSGNQLPLPRELFAGPKCFSWIIPSNDRSMVGAGPTTFKPDTLLAVDPDREIMPDDYALVWPFQYPGPIVRQIRSQFPISTSAPRFPFELVPLNTNFETILCEEDEDVQVIGRVILIMYAV